MKINEAFADLWQKGFFEKPQLTGTVKGKLSQEYGIYPSNISMSLSSCKLIRRDKQGWVQKTRYQLSQNSSHDPCRDLYLQVSDSRLINSCKSDFSQGNYWDAVFKALRHLEVRTREKTGLPASDHGADLMEKAFRPNVGFLVIPSCATEGEQDGFKQIMKGIMMFHRNAKGHREESIDKIPALKILGYADYLLKIIDTARRR